MLRRFAFVLLAASLAAAAPLPFPFESDKPIYPEELKRDLRSLQQAALQDDYALDQVGFLANQIGPRLSGSAQASAAVEYVAAELAALGLEVKKEPVTVPHWVRGREAAELTAWPGQPRGTTMPLVLSTLGGSVATPEEGLTAEVVVVDSFDQLKSLGDKVRGKIVVFNVVFDKNLAAMGHSGPAYGQHVRYRAAGPSAAARQGAVACLVRSWGSAHYRLAHTGNTRYEADVPKIPAASLPVEDALQLAYLTRKGPVRLHLTLTPQTLPDAPSHNVVADLKGSERPEEIVIVSGHLDSWDVGTGALDDGAGVAMAMQTAHLLKQLGLKPRRTVRVVAWMNEENGLAGGRTYDREHANDRHVAAIESDLGAGHPGGVEICGDPRLYGLLAPMAEILRASGAGALDFSRGSGADISPLAARGVPCFEPLQDSRTYFDYHHTQADTFDKIDPAALRENCAVIAVLAHTLASLP